MHLLHFTRQLWAFGLFVSLIVLSLPTVCAQNPASYNIVVQESEAGNGIYDFSTISNDLLLNDRVFYRFSDGYHLDAQKTSSNPNATVSRGFPNNASEPPTVIGYVTKKNGPLGIAYPPENPEIQTCTACDPPASGLGPDEYIRLSNSWDLFSNTQAAVPFTDNTTVPELITPGMPWFLLVVTMRAPAGSTYANIVFPPALSFAGAIVENRWGSGPDVANAFVESIDEPAGLSQTVQIKFNPGIAGEPFNVYLLMSGQPNSGAHLFSANVYDDRNKPLGTTSELRLLTRQWPHDPNQLMHFDESPCMGSTQNPPLQYQINFQNQGQGPADHVVVKVEIDPDVLDPVSVSDITTSENYTNPVIVSYGLDFVTFHLSGINLPGIGQSPQPTLAQTSGWIQFRIRTKDCIFPESETFQTKAFITFISESEGKPAFQETIQTNTTEQKLIKYCPLDPLCLKPLEGRSDAGGTLQSPACYPTLFNDFLTVEAPASLENGTIRVVLSDLAGKQWSVISKPVASGEFFRQQVETAHFPNGMYLVHFMAGGRTTVFKIVKNNL